MKVQKYTGKGLPFSAGEELNTSQEAFDSITPESTGREALGAMYDLSNMDAPWASLKQHAEISEAEKSGDLIEPKDLNEMYPDAAEPFTEPKNKAVADIIYARQKKRQELGQIISAGPDGKLMGMGRFGAAMLPHLLDPINIGAGVGLSALTAGVGLIAEGGEALNAARGAVAAARAAGIAKDAELAAIGVKAARTANVALDTAQAWEIGVEASRVASTGQKILSSPFVRHVGEGVISSLPGEALIARSSVQEGREYELKDAMYSMVAGAMLVPGLSLGFEKAAQGLRYTGKWSLNRAAEFLHRVDPKYSELLQSTSVGRLIHDKLPKTEVFIEQAVRELKGEMPSFHGAPDYTFNRIRPEEIKGKRFYVATYEGGGIKDVQTQSMDAFLGGAVYGTDSPIVANGSAARSIKDGNGRVIEVEAIDNMKLVNLNEKLPEELHDLFKENGVTLADLKKMSAHEVMEQFQDRIQSNDLDPHFMETFNEKLQAAGYDGYHSDGTRVEGGQMDPHNSLVILNKEKLNEVRDITPEPEKIGKLDPERVRALQEEAQSEVSEFSHDDPQQLIKDYEASVGQELTPPKLNDLDATELAFNEELANLDKQGLLNESQKAQFEEIKAAKADSEQLINMMKAAASCVGLD